MSLRLCTTLALITTAALAACSSSPHDPMATGAVAQARLQPTQGSSVQGMVRFTTQKDGTVRVQGSVQGLAPNTEHGFHVHEKGDCSSPDFNSAGGHFNPTSQPHGAHGGGKHHVGDMAELMTDANGTANISFNSSSLKLRGPNSIIGKAVIVHAAPDDVNAQPSGNAGARLVCGVIKQD